MSLHEILLLIPCATTQITLRIFKISPELSCTYMIYDKYQNLSAPACTACTDMVYSKELEREVTTTAMAKAILLLKTLAFIPS